MPPDTQTIVDNSNAMLQQLVDKALVDNDFRTRLVSDPKATAADELGITIPEHAEIFVHENDKFTYHLSLPRSPELELDDEQLELIAAGLCCCS